MRVCGCVRVCEGEVGEGVNVMVVKGLSVVNPRRACAQRGLL